MNFVLEHYPYHVDILSTTPRQVVARVYLPYCPDYQRGAFPVCDIQGRFLFGVWEVADAIQELKNYLSHDQRVWQPVYSSRKQEGPPKLFIQRTLFGELRVEEISLRSCIALRDGLPLRERGQDATFGSCGLAQHTAELHLMDGFDHRAPYPDGRHWLSDWKRDDDCLGRVIDRKLAACRGTVLRHAA
jgi:hypothetical protein